MEENTTMDADVFALLNAGAEKYSKRKGKKKSVSDDPMLDAPPIPTLADICQMDLDKAKEQNLENPEFDYRDFYERGDEIHFVRINNHNFFGKSLKALKVRTVYPRTVIGVEQGGECVCIGYEERDQIFTTLIDAQAFYDSINMIDEDKERALRKKREKQLKKQLKDEGMEDDSNVLEGEQGESASDDANGEE